MKITVSRRSQEYVRRRVQDHMNATVRIYRHAGDDFDEGTGVYSTLGENPYYSGKARIWQENVGAAIVVGEASITTTQTMVSVPFETDHPRKDDIVQVISSPNQTSLELHAFRVMAVEVGGFIGATHKMTCEGFDESGDWRRST